MSPYPLPEGSGLVGLEQGFGPESEQEPELGLVEDEPFHQPWAIETAPPKRIPLTPPKRVREALSDLI